MKGYWKALETTTIYVENFDEIVQPLFFIIYIKNLFILNYFLNHQNVGFHWLKKRKIKLEQKW